MLFQIDVPLSLKGRIIVEAIEGMCYLHDKGVIHKDLKPEKILVDRDFHIKVIHNLYTLRRLNNCSLIFHWKSIPDHDECSIQQLATACKADMV